MKQAGFSAKWQQGKNTITFEVPLMIFQEKGTYIQYIPALDISGYGKTEQEAYESLQHTLCEYFSYTVNKKTLFDDLKAHGWTIRKKTKPFIAPEITDLINRNQYLHDIVNTKPYRMDRIDVNLPKFATA